MAGDSISIPNEIEQLPVRELSPSENNARTHSAEQIDQIAEAITQWGWTNPVLINEQSVILAGHGRVEAAKRLKLKRVPCIRLTGLTAAQERALVIADNKLALNAGWDEEMLRSELSALQEIEYDIGPIGFGDDELAHIFRTVTGGADPEDTPEPPDDPVARLGDCWLLGNHRLVCGDCTDAGAVDLVLGEHLPNLMVTDPPYGVNYDPAWRGKAKRPDGSPLSTGNLAVGEVQNDDRADWTDAWLLFPGNVAYVWHGALHAGEVEDSLAGAQFNIRSVIIWNKPQAPVSRADYHWQHEPLFYAVRKGRPGNWHGGRKQTTVWDIANNDGTNKNREKNTGHGTQKPVECMKRPIENNSKPGEHVYEPFSGSGTTIIAGEMTGRHVLAIELNPQYVDVAITRWQDFAESEARLEGDGRTFAEISAERLGGGKKGKKE